MAKFFAGPSAANLQVLAIPGVALLITFLGYSSQYLFNRSANLEPGPLTPRESLVFNALLLCLWYTYFKACTVSPGRFVFPAAVSGTHPSDASDKAVKPDAYGRKRWCKKCSRPKPPRAHHCKHCKRCIPKMDHHCPWTGNCVSHTTFPHFYRFLVYTNLSLWALGRLLFARFRGVWTSRHLPSYLGPSLGELIHLTILGIVGGVVALALGIMLFHTTKGWMFNTTMIEGWEVERHEEILERRGDGDVDASWWRSGEAAPGGDEAKLLVEPVEFPYDISIWTNMAQAMGTANVLAWLFPFAGSPRVADDGAGKGSGWEWEENGFNDREGMWPPIDPDKMRNAKLWRERRQHMDQELALDRERGQWRNPEEERQAFRARQERDLKRWQRQREQILGELEEVEDYDYVDEHYRKGKTRSEPSAWTNSDGERLDDFGVDEDADADDVITHADRDDEDIPLAELIRRRKGRNLVTED